MKPQWPNGVKVYFLLLAQDKFPKRATLVRLLTPIKDSNVTRDFGSNRKRTPEPRNRIRPLPTKTLLLLVGKA